MSCTRGRYSGLHPLAVHVQGGGWGAKLNAVSLVQISWGIYIFWNPSISLTARLGWKPNRAHKLAIATHRSHEAAVLQVPFAL